MLSSSYIDMKKRIIAAETTICGNTVDSNLTHLSLIEGIMSKYCYLEITWTYRIDASRSTSRLVTPHVTD